jgi:capsular polysaccharide biosynthesis protein
VPSEAVRRTADKEPLLRTEDYRNMVLGFIAGFALAVLGFVVRKYVI